MDRTELDALAMLAGLAAARRRAPGGVTIRPWQADADYVPMAEVRSASALDDGQDFNTEPDQLRADVEVSQVKPAVTTLLAEVDARVVGWARISGPGFAPDIGVVLTHGGGVIPEARRRGIGRALLAGIQAIGRGRLDGFEIPPGARALFQTYAGMTPAPMALLEGDGYSAARWAFGMVRRSLDAIPDRELPAGVELRPVLDEAAAFRVVRAMNAAMADHPGWIDLGEEQSRAAVGHPIYGQTDVWQVAWVGDEPVAGVLGYVDESENQKRGRLRGYTEAIWTARPWRRRGLASALIAANLRLLRELGLTEAALFVDTENPSGALRVYERMGFEAETKEILYRRPV